MITQLLSLVYEHYTKKMINSYTEFISALKTRTGRGWQVPVRFNLTFSITPIYFKD